MLERLLIGAAEYCATDLVDPPDIRIVGDLNGSPSQPSTAMLFSAGMNCADLDAS
jgi:hypothetical protein